MNAPTGLIGAGLLIWGWQNEVFWLGLLLGVLLEAARGLPWRWQLTDRELYLLVDFCGVGLLALVAYSLLSQELRVFLIEVVRWLPLVLYLLVWIQRYSDRPRLPWAALSMRQRRRGAGGGSVNVDYAFLIICMIAASMGNRMPLVFFMLVAGLWAWLLWGRRSHRYRFGVWLAMLLIAILMGFGLHHGIVLTQHELESRMPMWLLQWFKRPADPFQVATALGRIGELKLSDRIELRLEPMPGAQAPSLLHTASYNQFGGERWYQTERDFVPWQQPSEAIWQSREPSAAAQQVRILQTVERGRALLALPQETVRLDGLLAERVSSNAMGAVRVHETPDLLDFIARYERRPDSVQPPVEADSKVSIAYQDSLDKLLRQLHLDGRSAMDIAASLQHWFATQFRYSLKLSTLDSGLPPVLDFLLNTRAGHCEYFASATVLFLRQAGIPARYAVGYSVQEYSPLEGRYIVRRRHGHAWAQAWIDGRWRDIDTTPPVWFEEDAARSAWWTPAYDVLSWTWVWLNEWRIKTAEVQWESWLAWWLLPLIAILIWRLRGQRRVRQAVEARLSDCDSLLSGADSEVYRIVEWYRRQGHPPCPGTTLAAWLQSVLPNTQHEWLRRTLHLHYRYRFDPKGLTARERQELRQRVQDWQAHDDSA